MLIALLLLQLSAGDLGIYVDGNNPAASRIRKQLKDSKECVSLVTKRSDADAILAVKFDAEKGRYMTTTTVTGMLTKDDEYVWDESVSLYTGTNTAADELLKKLKKELCPSP